MRTISGGGRFLLADPERSCAVPGAAAIFPACRRPLETAPGSGAMFCGFSSGNDRPSGPRPVSGGQGFLTTHTTAFACESVPTTRRVPSVRTLLRALALPQRLAGSCNMPLAGDQKNAVLVPFAKLLSPTTSPDALMSRAELSLPPSVPRS